MQLAMSPSMSLELHRSLGRAMPAPLPVRGRVSPVRRRLFDTDDADADDEQERLCAVERQLDAIRLEQKRRWNFDFVGERPLTGRFQWQRAGALDAHRRLKRPYSDADTDADACPALKVPRADVRIWALNAPLDTNSNKIDASDATDATLSRRQTKITGDFMTSKFKHVTRR